MKIKRTFIGSYLDLLDLVSVQSVLFCLCCLPFRFFSLQRSARQSSERLHKWFIGTKLYKKQFGILCKRSRYDFVHQNQGYGYSNASDGVWLLYDVPQGSVYPLCHSRRRVAVPYRIFHLGHKNIRRVLILRMRT